MSRRGGGGVRGKEYSTANGTPCLGVTTKKTKTKREIVLPTSTRPPGVVGGGAIEDARAYGPSPRP